MSLTLTVNRAYHDDYVPCLSIVEMRADGPWLHALADRSHLERALRSRPGT